MSEDLPLENMTIEEKLAAMEEIWDDLVRHADSFNSPEWHHTILKDRENNLAKGTERTLDWEETKKVLKKNFE